MVAAEQAGARVFAKRTAMAEKHDRDEDGASKHALVFPQQAKTQEEMEPYRLGLEERIYKAGAAAALEPGMLIKSFATLDSSTKKVAGIAYGIIKATLNFTQIDRLWVAGLEGDYGHMKGNAAWLLEQVMNRKPKRIPAQARRRQ